MATSAKHAPQLLVDTSVAVALSIGDHRHHQATSDAVGDRRLGLAGHAAFEAFSVLTRLPAPARRTPATVARLLAATFPTPVFSASRPPRLYCATCRPRAAPEGRFTTRLSAPSPPSTGWRWPPGIDGRWTPTGRWGLRLS